MGLSGVVGLADWVLVVGCVRVLGWEMDWWLGNVGCGGWVVVPGVRNWVSRNAGRRAGVGGLQRGKRVLVVRAERQLGSGA